MAVCLILGGEILVIHPAKDSHTALKCDGVCNKEQAKNIEITFVYVLRGRHGWGAWSNQNAHLAGKIYTQPHILNTSPKHACTIRKILHSAFVERGMLSSILD